MSDPLDKLVGAIQDEADAEVRRLYGETVYKRWKNPEFSGRMDDADARGSSSGECGDTIEIYLKIKNGVIREASFYTDGCGPSIVAGDMTAELVRGRDLDRASMIDGEAVLTALGGLPEEKRHCAYLAARALAAAIEGYLSGKR